MTATTAAAGTAPFAIPSGTDVYDALMAGIEPDLVTANIPLLGKKYAEETLEQRAVRYQRYENAYVQYDTAFVRWVREARIAIKEFRRTVLVAGEAKSRRGEEQTLSSITTQISA